MMNRLKKNLKSFLGSNWGMPVAAALGSAACAGAAMLLTGLSFSASVEERHWLSMGIGGVLISQAALFLGLPLWLLALTVYRLNKKQHFVWWAWLWSFIAALPILFCMVVSSFYTPFGCFDDFTLGIKVPDELSPERKPGMAVPVDMHFQAPLNEGINAALPPIVQQYANLCKTDNGVSISPDEKLTDSAPNVEKLVAEAPELLLEYKLRAFCHRALSPGVRAAPNLAILQHPGEPIQLREEDRGHSKHQKLWHKELPNGWQIHDWSFFADEKASVPSDFQLKAQKLLDEGLAPLVAEPTREKLDTLLPPLPDKPAIVLAERDQPGIYALALVVPADYPEGRFRVTAREYTTGNKLSTRKLDSMQLTPQPHRQICKLAFSEDTITVYSGEWGEYYASVWELHFTPAGGGESRCVNSQIYLMQGWSR